MQNKFGGWNNWNGKSLGHIADGFPYVLVTDITGFYDHIHLETLSSDLRTLGLEPELIVLLMRCLHRWTAPPNGIGLPQGIASSDILAKVYMDSIDKRIMEHARPYLRYVDDMRVFCKTEVEAKTILVELIGLLAKKGLTLNSGKTEILTQEKAQIKFSNPTLSIETLKTEVLVALDLGPSVDWFRLDEEFKNKSVNIPIKTFEHAFREHIVGPGVGKFNKTLFHFLLTRLGLVKSMCAVDFCVDCLKTHPEEMKFILRYFSAISVPTDCQLRIIYFLGSENMIYEYQKYEIIKWFYDANLCPKPLLPLARKWAFDRNQQTWLRAYCLAILGRNADKTDIDRIYDAYGGSLSDIEKAEIISSIAKMERSGRNLFYGRACKDGELVARAIRIAKRA